MTTRLWAASAATAALVAVSLAPAVSQDGPEPRPRPQLLPALATAAVPHDADDPAIWVHPTDPAKSLILGTDKIETTGGIYVFDLEGKLVQSITGLDRPNNVDVRPDFDLGGKTVDLAVATERGGRRLLVWAIDRETGRLTDVTGSTKVFTDRTGEEGAPMGVALYRRPTDGAIYAVVSSKTGPTERYLHQYRLVEEGGKVDVRFIRAFGKFSGQGEIEALAVDDETGMLYASDEGAGIRKYAAGPDVENANRELGFFGQDGYTGDREGLAILPTGPGKGWLLNSDQIDGGSEVHVYRREEGNAPVKVFTTGADATDGIEVYAGYLGERFPEGILVMMNSTERNFLVYDLRQVRAGLAD